MGIGTGIGSASSSQEPHSLKASFADSGKSVLSGPTEEREPNGTVQEEDDAAAASDDTDNFEELWSDDDTDGAGGAADEEMSAARALDSLLTFNLDDAGMENPLMIGEISDGDDPLDDRDWTRNTTYGEKLHNDLMQALSKR